MLENSSRFKVDNKYRFPSNRNGIETHWLRDRIANYHSLRSDWADLFARKNVKVYTTWYKTGSFHCAIADAIQSLGGVTAIYQRTYEPLTMPINMVSSDIVFAFSPANAAVERSNGSNIRYHVATGYLGDHRFKLLKDHAKAMRESWSATGQSASWLTSTRTRWTMPGGLLGTNLPRPAMHSCWRKCWLNLGSVSC